MKQRQASGSHHSTRQTLPLPLGACLASVTLCSSQNLCVSLTSLSGCTELEGKLALPPELMGAPGSRTRCTGQAPESGADAPVGEVGVGKPDSTLATGRAVRCLVRCSGRERVRHPWESLSYYGRVPLGPAAPPLSTREGCPPRCWDVVPMAALSRSPEAGTGWGPRL